MLMHALPSFALDQLYTEHKGVFEQSPKGREHLDVFSKFLASKHCSVDSWLSLLSCVLEHFAQPFRWLLTTVVVLCRTAASEVALATLVAQEALDKMTRCEFCARLHPSKIVC
jgi:hypothetical protein